MPGISQHTRHESQSYMRRNQSKWLLAQTPASVKVKFACGPLPRRIPLVLKLPLAPSGNVAGRLKRGGEASDRTLYYKTGIRRCIQHYVNGSLMVEADVPACVFQ